MKTLSWLCVSALVTVLAVPAARAQEFPKPGPEHEFLKKWEGVWDTTMKVAGMETKGTATYKMELGGLWLVSTFEGEFGGTKFHGKGLDSYDARKKKYVGIWVDSMTTNPLIMEGTYDKAKKTLTMTGAAPGPDGKIEKFKAVTEWQNEQTVLFSMYIADGKEPGFTIVYKRRK